MPGDYNMHLKVLEVWFSFLFTYVPRLLPIS